MNWKTMSAEAVALHALPRNLLAETAQSIWRLATGWTVRKSNPGGGKIFLTRPDRPWGPPSLLYKGHRVSFLGVIRQGRGVNHPPPSSAEVKERVELYTYFPSGPLWHVLGRNLPFLTSKFTVTKSKVVAVHTKKE